jgi:hypothetical protein
MLTLIESSVSETIRHSDSEPIASEAATASVSREESTGPERPLKPAVPGDRIMAQILQSAGRITFAPKDFLQQSPAILGRGAPGKRRNDGEKAGYARYSTGYTRYPRNPRVLGLGSKSGRLIDLGAWPPVHGHEAGDLLDPS